MSTGVEDRLRYEARTRPNETSTIFPGDVVEVIDNVKKQLSAAEAEVERLAEALEIVKVFAHTYHINVEIGNYYSCNICGQEGRSMNQIRHLEHCTLAAHDAAAGDGTPEGVICPICKHVISDADYWAGDMCVKCALEKE